jgi:hypothetical protein
MQAIGRLIASRAQWIAHRAATLCAFSGAHHQEESWFE